MLRVGSSPRRGMTLVELVLAIVVIAVAVLPTIGLFTTIIRPYFQAEAIDRCDSLARDLMEEILAKRFDELFSTGWMWSTLGPDTTPVNEVGDISKYDDVDDYYDFNQTLTGAYAGYTRTVAVNYVQGRWDDLSPDDVGEETAQEYPYKKIQVTVTGPYGSETVLTGMSTTSNSEGW